MLRPEEPEYYHCVEYHVVQENVAPPRPAKEGGSDTQGNQYRNTREMWIAQDLSSWYDRASDYYEENCDTTVDGVLGGLGFLTEVDLKASTEFVRSLGGFPKTNASSPSFACECGAGIGRVTKGLLLDVCDRCDLVESSSRLLSSAPDFLGDVSSRCRFYCSGLQDWAPAEGKYSLIWIQWVLCYLTDEDIVAYLQRCAKGLDDGGIIVMKENACADENFVVDVDDASVTRCLPYWLNLIDRAGLEVVRQRWQPELPEDIFPVTMLALQAKS